MTPRAQIRCKFHWFATCPTCVDPPELEQVGWVLMYHHGARCVPYVAPYCEGNPRPGPDWEPAYRVISGEVQ